MKKHKNIILAILACLLLVGCILLCSCKDTSKIDYYSDKDNYISVEATVNYIKYTDDDSAVYLSFEDIPSEFADDAFKITGENYRIIMGNNFADKVKEGSTIVFVSAPKYFGDGYVMPIVSITVDDEVLLEFEEGKDNLVAEYWYMWY